MKWLFFFSHLCFTRCYLISCDNPQVISISILLVWCSLAVYGFRIGATQVEYDTIAMQFMRLFVVITLEKILDENLIIIAQ